MFQNVRYRFGGVVLLCGVALGAAILAALPRSDEPETDGGGFTDATADSGVAFRMHFLPDEQGENFKINLYDHGCGVAVADYDADGDDDLYFLNQLGPNALYRNRGDGTFEDVTEEAGVALADRICVAAAFGDVDNDGDLDLYVTSTRGGNAFFRNDGARFVEATDAAGLALVRHSQAAAFFDFDRDGFLDLFVTNTAEWTRDEFDARIRYYRGAADLREMVRSPPERSVLYRNNGDGSFTDVTEAAGVGGKGWDGDVAVFDYDEDGWLDLFVANMFGGSRLYKNLGGGSFQDATREALGRVSWGCVGAKPMDADGDGRLDLFLVDMHSDMWIVKGIEARHVEEKRKYARFYQRLVELGMLSAEAEAEFAAEFGILYADVVFGNALYRNRGDGTFQETSDFANLETFWPWGVAAADFDGDGDEDAFVPSGMGYPLFYWRNALMMNDGHGTFADRSRAFGIDPPPGGNYLEKPVGGQPAARSSRSAATGDFDRDGRVDLAVNNFNDRATIYRNRFPKRRYVAFRLEGTRSNRDAVGAVVRVRAGGRTMVRQVHAAGGYLAQSSHALHFGLGDAQAIEWCEIRWPAGRVQILENLAADRVHRVVEPRD
jgi:hypothetical protein